MGALEWVAVLVLLSFFAVSLVIVRPAERERQRERQRTMLYEDLTVDEAQAIVWGWEEMTEDERAALSSERRAEIRKIREDLAAHKERWGLE